MQIETKEMIPFLAEKINQAQKSGKLDNRIAIVTNNKQHSHFIRKELNRELGILAGVDIGTINDIYLMNNTGNISDGLVERSIMVKTLIEMRKGLKEHYKEAATVHLVDTAASLLQVFKFAKRNQRDIAAIMPEMETLFDRYIDNLGNMGYTERISALENMTAPKYKLVIDLTTTAESPLERTLLDQLTESSETSLKVSIKLHPGMTGPMLKGERAGEKVNFENIYPGEFPKMSDEIKETCKLVKRKIMQGSEPRDIGIAAPGEYMEPIAIRLEEAGVPLSYSFNLPLKGNPAYHAMELILKLSSENADLKDVLAALNNPLIHLGDNWGNFRKFRFYLSGFIDRWGDGGNETWEYKLEHEKDRIGAQTEDKTKEILLEKYVQLRNLVMKYLPKNIENLPPSATLAKCARIMLENLNSANILKNVRSSRAITLQSSNVKLASRVYLNIEKTLLEMRKVGGDIELKKEDFLSLYNSELALKKRKVDSRIPDGVQLLELSEAEHRTFEVLVILGAGQSTFPSPPVNVPLIDRKTRMDISGEEHRERDLSAKISFLSMMEGCGEVFISHNGSDGDTWSPVVEQFTTLAELGPRWEKGLEAPGMDIALSHLEDLEKAEQEEELGLSDANTIMKRGKKLKDAELGMEEKIDNAREILEKTFMKEGIENHVWSTSRFESYIRCPFRFMCEYVFDIEEPREYTEEMDPRDKGSLIHDVIYEHLCAIDEVLDNNGCAGTPGERDARLDHIKDIAIKGISDISPLPLLREKMKTYLLGSGEGDGGLLHSFVDWEMSEEARPLYHEASFGLEKHNKGDLNSAPPVNITGPVVPEGVEDDAPLSMQFHGRIDRIDDLDGYWNVVDYKTGGVYNIGSDNISPIQLAVYHEAVKEVLAKEEEELGELKAGGMIYSILKNPKVVLKVMGKEFEKNKTELLDGNERTMGNLWVNLIKEVTDRGHTFHTANNTVPRIRQKDYHRAISSYTEPADMNAAINSLKDYEDGESYKFRNRVMELYAESAESFKHALFGKIFEYYRKLLNGEFSPDPDGGGCRFCYLKYVCKASKIGGDF